MQKAKPLVIVLLGPTASGKTSLAIKIAEKFNLPIQNIDSRQIYKGMDIGTAKPNKVQLKKAEHFLINLKQPNEKMTLYEFQQLARKSIEKSILKKGYAFLVGGSGLYIKSITKGFNTPPVPPQNWLRSELNSLGQETCYQLLKYADPNAARKIYSSDLIRTTRALEVIYCTGQEISSQQTYDPPPWRLLEIGLNPKDLFHRIQTRTVQIYSNGLLNETERLIRKFGKDLPLLQTIGYKEALEVIEGLSNLDEAINLTIKRTKQFAKRQRTWFRKQHDPYWLNDEEPLREAVSLIKSGLSL